MQPEIARLRESIASAQRLLDGDKARLAAIERNCCHQFGEPVSDPIYQKEYTIEGDAPGTMGVDWRGPVHVPAKTTPRWVRICKLCGRREETLNVVPTGQVRPVFPGDR